MERDKEVVRPVDWEWLEEEEAVEKMQFELIMVNG